MSTFKSLSREAHEAAKWRGHNMIPFKRLDDRKIWISHCRVCDKQMVIKLDPMPNDIDIGGEAVALGCS